MSYDYKISDLKFRINSLVPKNICEKLINICEKYPELHTKESSYKHNLDEHKIDNFTCLNLSSINNPNEDILNGLSICKTYLSIMISNYDLYLKKNICPSYNKQFIVKTNNIRILKYGKGQLIEDHTDVNTKRNTRASCTLNLNEDYKGGEFRFFNGQIKESFKTGDGMIFPAEPIWVHGTEPIIDGIRYSVNCFLSD